MRARLVALVAAASCAHQAPPAPVAASAAPAPPAPAPAAPVEPTYMETPPKVPDARPFTAPAPARFTLPNGLEVVLFEKHNAPLVTFLMQVKSGATAEPAAKAGLATLTADLLDEGAGSRGALELAEAVEQLGADLTTGATYEGSAVSLTVLSDRLDQAGPLFADIVLRPRLAPKDFARVRGELLGRLAQRRTDPRSMATLASVAAVYGDSAYGRPAQGYATTVSRLTVADVHGFHDRFYRPNNAVLVVVGDVTAADLEARAVTLFG